MITRLYSERVAQDIVERSASVLLNDSIEVTIRDISSNGLNLSITTGRIEGVNRIESLKLLDENGQSIIERRPMKDVSQTRSLEFRFEIEVVQDVV